MTKCDSSKFGRNMLMPATLVVGFITRHHSRILVSSHDVLTITFLSFTYVHEITGIDQISTILGRCMWPCDLACHILPPPPPWLLHQNLCSNFIIFMFYNFFLGCAAPCINIWGSAKICLGCPFLLGAEYFWTCGKFLEFTECVYLNYSSVKIKKNCASGGNTHSGLL